MMLSSAGSLATTVHFSLLIFTEMRMCDNYNGNEQNCIVDIVVNFSVLRLCSRKEVR